MKLIAAIAFLFTNYAFSEAPSVPREECSRRIAWCVESCKIQNPAMNFRLGLAQQACRWENCWASKLCK